MRNLAVSCVIVLAAVTGFGLGRRSATIQSVPPSPWESRHAGLTIQQIQPLSSLVTTRVDVADVVEGNLVGYTGAVKAAILVKGDFLLGVDLTQARFDSVDPDRRTATLLLPRPTLASPRVDHSRTRVFGISM